ncbi:MAG: protein kinase [Lachnospiraceae bacterium]|nr:protein kinase [Lachnospiraceae bacterium]
MSQIIAGLYEIEQKIGAGGGGIVYLGRHIRLNKKVVLKADKRQLSVGEEKLRREVDLLKGLSQTYIPQVYDFVEENGVVYTVMDFIDGESVDKLIARKQIPSQADVIKWACQLLEALNYLHSQPPYGILHGDIKPANIMLKPDGDICLIDYNIALALGENGAVKVGYSIGYASPEHYGAEYISEHRAAAGVVKKTQSIPKVDVTDTDDKTLTDTDRTVTDDSTVYDAPINNLKVGTASVGTGSTTNGKTSLMLDVRSDIYSLGATLYHIISGMRPAKEAKEVVPLSSDICSPAVSLILQKAMAPLPEDRYQSAEEMLNAFLSLHKNDRRIRKHKRRIWEAAGIIAIMFVAGGSLTFTGLKKQEQRSNALALAEYSSSALLEGNVSQAVEYALEAIPDGSSIFDAPVTAQAQKALTDALGVYDLSDSFQAVDTIKLDGAPFDIVTSPQGTLFAAVYAYKVSVYDAESLDLITTLPVEMSAFSDVCFVDEDRIVYAGEGGVRAYDLSSKTELWKGDVATILSLSADGKKVAAVNRDAESFKLYNTADGTVIHEGSFGGKHLSVPANDIFADSADSVFALNDDGTMLAASFSNGGLLIFDLGNSEEDMIIYDDSEYTHFEGGFCGDYFAFSASASGKTQVGIIDCRNGVYAGGFDASDRVLIQTDNEYIYMANGGLLSAVSPQNVTETELAYTETAVITDFSVGKDYIVAAADDGSMTFYDSGANPSSSIIGKQNFDFVRLCDDTAIGANRDEPELRILMLEQHKAAEILKYDARYVHDEARLNEDGSRAMLFDINGFRIYSRDGELLKECSIPDSAHIYDQQFRREEGASYLEVIWYDGTVKKYSAEDGSLIAEEKKDAPNRDLYEEFYTGKYRIASELHSAPVVYDASSGEELATLEEDAYLTYVTELGDMLVTEYVGADGERFGILLDENLEKLAVLPKLCDVWNGSFIFDYESGNLRQSRIYSLPELVALGESYR